MVWGASHGARRELTAVPIDRGERRRAVTGLAACQHKQSRPLTDAKHCRIHHKSFCIRRLSSLGRRARDAAHRVGRLQRAAFPARDPGARLLQGLLTLIIGGFLVVHVLADQFGLERIAVLYQPFVWTVLIVTVIVFQPELRRGLMRLGETRLRRPRRLGARSCRPPGFGGLCSFPRTRSAP